MLLFYKEECLFWLQVNKDYIILEILKYVCLKLSSTYPFFLCVLWFIHM